MAKLREVLEKLPAEVLAGMAEEAGVGSPHLDGLEKLGAGRIKVMLAELPRAALKEACRALGLDDSGREKLLMVDRLIPLDSKAPAPAPAPTAPRAPTGKLTQADLERHLWSAADILRGSIDSSDYKNFIFGLLFLKRLSDRFEEECVAVRAEGGNPEDPDEHEFFVPKRARWAEVQKHATNLGEVLNKAASAIEHEAHNGAALEGVLGGIDFNDERKLGDARQRDQVLARLIQHFANLDLRNASLSEPDMLGRAYEFLIERFADDAGKKGGEFYTPRKVVQLIVELLEPTERMRICDPTVGSGGMLIECAHHVARRGGNPKNLSLCGQEKNLGTWAICKMNMLLHGIHDAQIEKGDTIRDPKLVQDGALMVFDRVIANPPFSLKEWGRDVAENDPWGRFGYGIPPRTKGDLAFVQHMVAVLNKHGKLGVVMPHGVLFRSGSESEIRRRLLRDDLIEAVIGLPENIFYGAAIPTIVMIINRSKPSARRGKLIFIEAARDFGTGVNLNHLRASDVSKIVSTVRDFVDVKHYARVVPFAEIQENDCNLNISRYVETEEAKEKVDVGIAVMALREAERARDAAKESMDRHIQDLGHPPEGWSEVRLGNIFAEVTDKNHRDRLPVLAVTLDRGVVRRDSLERKMDREVEQGAYLRALPGDIAYNTMRMWQGGSGLVREPGFVSPAYTIVRARGEECPEFWAHAFKSSALIGCFGAFSQGVAKDRHRLYYDQFAAVRTLRPPLEEQRKVAAILSSIDEAIEKTQAMLTQLDAVKKATREELLTRGVPGPPSEPKETGIGEGSEEDRS